MARKDRHSVLELVPKIDEWQLANGHWNDASDGDNDAKVLEMVDTPLTVHLVSPDFSLNDGMLYSFRLSGTAVKDGRFSVALVRSNDVDAPFERWVRTRQINGEGDFAGSFSFLPVNDDDYRLLVANGTGTVEQQGARLSDLELEVTAIGPIESKINAEPPNTYLPHWNKWQRRIHDKCKKSRVFNALVQAIEMKFDREEVLSLPSFIALCPTGQCNALCDFCSVTINRTGIIKRQLPWEDLARFLQPVRNVLQLCGLEGNGEPTMYKQFDELLGYVKRQGTEVYLITNGSRFMPSQIPQVLTLNNITFSLNAASAETHRKVMKLKNWPDVVGNIRRIVQERGDAANPVVNLSFVVYNYNIHELQEYLRFAEYDLKGDKIVIRPLSELGTGQLGTIEDLRDIVPFESDVQDAIDAVNEYLHDVPRRQYVSELGHVQSEIIFDASAFRNVRPDPTDKVVVPYGFEGRLLAPRRAGWAAVSDAVRASWHLSTVNLFCEKQAPKGVVWFSEHTPVDPKAELTFTCTITRSYGNPFQIQIVDEAGLVIGEQTVDPRTGTEDTLHHVSITVNSGKNRQLALQVARERGYFWAEIDFERLRTPGAMIRSEFKAPNARRWAADNPEVMSSWKKSQLSLTYDGGTTGYLYKSYFAPCIAGEKISFPLSADVKGGPVVLGVLNETAQSWITQFVFSNGHTDKEITIDPGTNRKIQFVIFSKTGAPFEALFDWGDVLEPAAKRHIGDDQAGPDGQNVISVGDYFDMGDQTRWSCPDPSVSTVTVMDGGLSVVTTGRTGAVYVAQSLPFTIPRHTNLNLSWELDKGSSTNFAIGVVNTDTDTFVLTAPGTQKSINVQSAECTRFAVVLYSSNGKPVNINLRWQPPTRDYANATPIPVKYAKNVVSLDAAEEIDAREADATVPEILESDVEELSEAEEMADALEAAGKGMELPPVDYRELTAEELNNISRRRKVQPKKDSTMRRLFGRRSRKYFCQKPWTDLNNFSVDGRMDVCCMTTGASQSEYALGNIMDDDFQAIWNGEAIREFRRTVNTEDKLSPCDRCAMAYSYAGLFFGQDFTLSVLRTRLEERFGNNFMVRMFSRNLLPKLLQRFHFDDFR